MKLLAAGARANRMDSALASDEARRLDMPAGLEFVRLASFSSSSEAFDHFP